MRSKKYQKEQMGRRREIKKGSVMKMLFWERGCCNRYSGIVVILMVRERRAKTHMEIDGELDKTKAKKHLHGGDINMAC